MTPNEQVRRFIDAGKLAEEEGLQLLAALEAAEARDRVILEELRHTHATRQSLRLWALIAFGILALALGGLIAAAVVVPGTRPSASAQAAQEAQQWLGQDLDLVIDKLETKLRQPGSAADYRLLGMAYEARYQRTHLEGDRQGAAEAFARAERQEGRTMMKGNPAIFGLLFVVVIVTAVVIWIMAMYNGLARADERVNERWAQVEAVLQRRLDLIPQLVQTVKGYATHERQTLMTVTEARATMLGILQGTSGSAPKSPKAVGELNQAQHTLTGALKQLLALAESYPDLKANTSFITLQDQLEGTENRIAIERQRYNDGVRDYNARLRVFPSNVVAGMFGYAPREYFESALGAEKPVSVSFK